MDKAAENVSPMDIFGASCRWVEERRVRGSQIEPGIMLSTMSRSAPFASDLDLRAVVRACARTGHARIADSISPGFLQALRTELDAGPFEAFQESFAEVSQQIDGYDVAAPMEGFPILKQLCRELRGLVRSHGRSVRGLATWTPNEVGITHYVPGSIGITPHMDGKWYRRLVAVVTVYGRAPFAICGSRDPLDVVDSWVAGPGDLVLMRAPGLAGARDGRPFHLVGEPQSGERLSLGIRMTVNRPGA